MSQYTTLQEAKKQEAKLKVLMPTYGLVEFPGLQVPSKDDGETHEYGIVTDPRLVVDGEVKHAGEYMNAGLVKQTFENAPTATEAAIRLVSMGKPGLSRADAIGIINSIPAVSSATEAVLIEAFK